MGEAGSGSDPQRDQIRADPGGGAGAFRGGQDLTQLADTAHRIAKRATTPRYDQQRVQDGREIL